MAISVEADLPFPLRLTGGPFEVRSHAGLARLRFRTERHEHPDQRVHGGGNFDFLVDRFGWASYSHVAGDVDPSDGFSPEVAFIACLNVIIDHLRDQLSLFWVREVEIDDLFGLTVGSNGQFAVRMGAGRTEGFGAAITGLSESAVATLKERLTQESIVEPWRILLLDAEDALRTGRYEQAVVLGWSALEIASRSSLPRLARGKGLAIADLWRLLHRNEPKREPYSEEQAVEAADARSCIRVMCELANATHDSGSLAMSARDAYRLRNRVVHQGFRLSPIQARRAIEAIQFIIRSAGLPTTLRRAPFDTENWQKHFGTVSNGLADALGVTSGRIVLYRANERSKDPLEYPFSLERHDDTFTVTLPPNITEPAAAALFVVTNDSFGLTRQGHAFLEVSESAKDLLIPGLLDSEAGSITQACHFAYSLLRREQEGWDVHSGCEHVLDTMAPLFAGLAHSFDRPDVRFDVVASRWASYLLRAPEPAAQRFKVAVQPKHGPVLSRAVQLTEALSRLRADEPHSICRVLREIHVATTWLDSILVICPEEGATYGTARREIEAIRRR